MDQSKFIINTTMSKEDYRKFLYIATFRRNKLVVPFIVLISLIASLIITLDGESFNYIKLFISWILFFIIAIAVVIFKVERKNAQRVKTDKTGTFDSTNILKFYDERIVFENEALNSKGELKYDQFYSLVESKDYFIFYLTVNRASLLRKKDIENLSVFREFIADKFEGKYKRV